MFFRWLFADRTETGQVFTWFNESQLWQLKRFLLWQPRETGHLRLHARDVDEMSLARAVETFNWVYGQRLAEAEAQRKANEDAIKRARGG